MIVEIQVVESFPNHTVGWHIEPFPRAAKLIDAMRRYSEHSRSWATSLQARLLRR